MAREITVQIHAEDGSLWAQVVEYPGVFAAGDTYQELLASLQEGLQLVLGDVTVETPQSLSSKPKTSRWKARKEEGFEEQILALA